TPFNDTSVNHFFQIELRSTSPLNNEDVNGNGVLDAGEDLNGNGLLDSGIVLANSVSTTKEKGVWRIHRHNNANTPNPNLPLGISGGLGIAPTTIPADENVLTLLKGVGTVAPGALFTIANADS